MNEWISVEDALPDDCEWCLATGSDIEMEIVFYDLCDGWREDYDITHWMSLPELPNND